MSDSPRIPSSCGEGSGVNPGVYRFDDTSTRRQTAFLATAQPVPAPSGGGIGALSMGLTGRGLSGGATIFQALGISGDQRLGKDGFTRPVSTGQPLLELF